MDHSDPAKPVRVFESGSILLYLCDKFDKDGKFFPKEYPARAECQNWLMWQMGSAPFIGGGFGHFYHYAPVKYLAFSEKFDDNFGAQPPQPSVFGQMCFHDTSFLWNRHRWACSFYGEVEKWKKTSAVISQVSGDRHCCQEQVVPYPKTPHFQLVLRGSLEGWTMMDATLRIEYAINRYSMETKRLLDVLDKHLGEGDKQYVCGDQYLDLERDFVWIFLR